MAALHLAHGDVPSAQLDLMELVAWLAFDKPKQAETAGDPVNILVVDDRPDAAKSECAMISHLGHVAVMAQGAREVETLIGTFSFDVVIVDTQHVDLVQKLRGLGRPLRVVGLVGEHEPGEQSRAFDAGCDHCITRPVNLEKLRRLVMSLAPGSEKPSAPR
jgi:DNA-binding response OmpR family regulator